MIGSTVKLGDICDVSAGQSAPQGSDFYGQQGNPFIRAGSLESLVNGGKEEDCEWISDDVAEQHGMRLYPRNTIVFAKSGMSATIGRIYRLKRPCYIVSHLATLIPNNAEPSYIQRWLEHNPPSRLIPNSAYPSIRTSEIAQLKLPLPSPSEQKRIAAILDKADEIRKKRRQAIEELNTLIPSIFYDMFGDPVTNNKNLPLSSIDSVCDLVSGGTPSKSKQEYWEGSFPWVSPKDMKQLYINDAIDHISTLAFDETTIKEIPINSILIVVRGMILAHTAPIALSTARVAINQDMKALLIRDTAKWHPEFVFWALKQQDRFILSRVETAAHGTKRLEANIIKDLFVPAVDYNCQCDFAKKVCAINKMQSEHEQSAVEADDLFNSLVQRAFKGEL